MKKIVSVVLSLVMLFAIMLTGCNKDGYVGSYSFRMGKLEGKHFSVSMRLTNDNYLSKEGEVLGQKFELTLDFFSMLDLDFLSSEEQSEEQIDQEQTENEDSDVDLSGIMDFLKEGITISGYYKEGESSSLGKRLLLGLSFNLFIEQLDEKYGDTLEEFIGLRFADLIPSDFNIDNELIELLLIAYVNNKQVSLVLPVSLDDLKYQLYWYGYDIDFDSGEFKETTKHEVGTHPTKEDVEKINETYPDDHKEPIMRDVEDSEGNITKEPVKDDTGNIMYEPFEYYRDFYTINLSLLKE